MNEKDQTIQDAIEKIETAVSEGLGEWDGVQIPYCPEWCLPYISIAEAIEDIKAVLNK
jgi:hypothetical protein